MTFHSHARLTVAVLALSGLAAAGIAVADTTTVSDKKGDAKCGHGPCIDLKSGTAGHDSGKLVHTIELHTRLPRFPGSPLVVWISTSPRRGAEYTVQAFPEGTFVMRSRDGKRTGRATYKKLSRTKVRYAFAGKAIGRPSAYEWKVSAEGGGDRTMDSVPNRGFERHDLSLP